MAYSIKAGQKWRTSEGAVCEIVEDDGAETAPLRVLRDGREFWYSRDGTLIGLEHFHRLVELIEDAPQTHDEVLKDLGAKLLETEKDAAEALNSALYGDAALLTEREKTHGSYSNVSAMSQNLKEVLRTSEDGWARLSPEQAEALDCICMKMARILSGDPKHKDHWSDISGYASLGGKVFSAL